ncbi:hypothetical protein [Burkholderia vietnamiensis]|uniref:hypothetical protein n=1 Tax=Burkholderia vietnamiensis TaxID=60552 RepID=UPI00069999E5|nr:hypothetical protein [Burkholderia vietnamiensis]
MQILMELPDGTISQHVLEAIERAAIAEIRQYADGRRANIARGAETRGLAALLVDKYGAGMAQAFVIAGIESTVRAETDRLVRELDPGFERHRDSRWAARPAGIAIVPSSHNFQKDTHHGKT